MCLMKTPSSILHLYFESNDLMHIVSFLRSSIVHHIVGVGRPLALFLERAVHFMHRVNALLNS